MICHLPNQNPVSILFEGYDILITYSILNGLTLYYSPPISPAGPLGLLCQIPFSLAFFQVLCLHPFFAVDFNIPLIFISVGEAPKFTAKGLQISLFPEAFTPFLHGYCINISNYIQSSLIFFPPNWVLSISTCYDSRILPVDQPNISKSFDTFSSPLTFKITSHLSIPFSSHPF